MGEAVEIQVFGRYGLALARVGPRLVVTNGTLADRVAVARRPLDVATAAESGLATCAAKVRRLAAEAVCTVSPFVPKASLASQALRKRPTQT